MLWGGVAFLLAQLGLLIAFAVRTPSRDPEYDLHLASLQARLKERGPGRPLVLLLGSSRVGLNVRPGLMAVNRTAPGGGPVVFNFGLCYSGPVLELLCLHRLLADGVHPDALLVELFPLLASSDEESLVLYRERFRWDDLGVLRPYNVAGSDRLGWLKRQCLPWHSYHNVLLDQWAPFWLSPDRRRHVTWDALDGWGWNAYPSIQPHDLADQCARIDGTRAVLVPLINQFQPRVAPRRALDELARTCKKEKIALAFILSPDLFLSDYDPAARARIDDFARAIGREHDAPVIDAREWFPEEAFCEGVHLTYSGAAAYTTRVEREVLRPYLDGNPLARRWPAGAPATPLLVQCGAGFSFLERDGAVRRRWCGPRGELVLFNSSDRPRTVALRFTARTRSAGTAALALESSFLSGRLAVGRGDASFERVFALPPGRQVVRLNCDAAASTEAVGALVFGLSDCTLTEAEDGPTGGRAGRGRRDAPAAPPIAVDRESLPGIVLVQAPRFAAAELAALRFIRPAPLREEHDYHQDAPAHQLPRRRHRLPGILRQARRRHHRHGGR